jgi:hypothetical protein
MAERKATIKLFQNDPVLKEDFVLKVQTENPNITRAWIETENGTKTAMVCFYPKFDTKDVNSEMYASSFCYLIYLEYL